MSHGEISETFLFYSKRGNTQGGASGHSHMFRVGVLPREWPMGPNGIYENFKI